MSMNNDFFGPLQSYIIVLEFARRLLDSQNNEDDRIEYRMNSRIHNNAFCGLIKHGYPNYINNEKTFVILELNEAVYKCPVNTAQNILGNDHFKKIVDSNSSVGKKYIKYADDTHKEPDMVLANNFPVINLDNADKIVQKKDENSLSPFLTVSEIPLIDDIVFPQAENKRILDIGKPSSSNETGDVMAPKTKGISTDEGHPLFKPRQPLMDKSRRISDFRVQEEKNDYSKPNIDAAFHFKTKAEISESKTQEKHKGKFLSSLFGGTAIKKEKSSWSNSVSENNTEETMLTLGEKNEKEYTHDGGALFRHVHQVLLRKQFGTDSIGPYRFVFWPCKIPDNDSREGWADILVHVTGPDGSELIACTDNKIRELHLNLGSKDFKVFALWNNGDLETNVTLEHKTASMFMLCEEVQVNKPELPLTDKYLEQFRFEQKGQPKHFVVPFKTNNRGEKNIPIVGYVELDTKRYPLERRDGNTLRYRWNSNEKVIQGQWRNGKFHFLVEDTISLNWEERADD